MTGDASFQMGTQVSYFRPGGHIFKKALGQAARGFSQGMLFEKCSALPSAITPGAPSSGRGESLGKRPES